MENELNEYLAGLGIKDYDDLRPDEKQEYFKLLEIMQSSAITLDDFRKHVKAMRQSIEAILVDEPEYVYSLHLPFLKRINPRQLTLKARLKNYLLFEAFFDRPDLNRKRLPEHPVIPPVQMIRVLALGSQLVVYRLTTPVAFL